METTWREKVLELEAQGLTLVQIGAEVGLTTASVSDIKQGRTKNGPTGMAAVRLYLLHRSRVLGVSDPANDDAPATPDHDGASASEVVG